MPGSVAEDEDGIADLVVFFFSTLFQEHSSLEILIRGSDGIERFLVKSPMNLSRFGEIPMGFCGHPPYSISQSIPFDILMVQSRFLLKKKG